ncbi:MAG TPA: type II toxin-antitoxin system HicA family toxin [Armatimonadota bacterium]|nr:type II toxin-antitoxin system HicA family toxin [Armatimonadota bacterium]
MKVRDVLRRLHDEGWYEVRTSGSHRILKHRTRPGMVVVAGHTGKDLAPGTLKHICEQAGWRDRA